MHNGNKADLSCTYKLNLLLLLLLLVVIMKRRPPALGDSGRFIQSLSVQKLTNSSDVSYKITASPYNCAFDFPLLEIGFLQVCVSQDICFWLAI